MTILTVLRSSSCLRAGVAVTMRLGWSRMPSRGVSADLTGGASANLTADCFLQSPPQLRNTNTKQEAKSKPNIQKTSSSQPTHYSIMPPVRTARASRKAPPEGFDDIEDTLLEFQTKMKDAENASHEGKKKYEMTWPIFQITHQRSRYIYDLYYTKEAISKQLYDYLLKNGYADPMLIAKWKKQGYEKLCCTRCIQTKETNFRSTCICRVPRDQLKENQEIECVNCGCRGCASSD